MERLTAPLNERLLREEIKDTASLLRSAPPSVTYLIFSAGPGLTKAVPLEHVLRLETVDASAVQMSGDKQSIVYNGASLPLCSLPLLAVPTRGQFNVILLRHGEQTVGLVVEEILDILMAPRALASASQGVYAGSAVIAGKVTDIIDVERLLQGRRKHAANIQSGLATKTRLPYS